LKRVASELETAQLALLLSGPYHPWPERFKTVVVSFYMIKYPLSR